MRDKSYHYWMRKEVQRLFPHSQAVVATQNVEEAVFRSFSKAVGTRVVRLGAGGTAAAF